MFLLICVLALTGAVLGRRNPNPCEGVTTDTTFANDWSTCGDYFWCNFDKAVPSGPCPIGMGFIYEKLACSSEAATCDECPADDNIAVS